VKIISEGKGEGGRGKGKREKGKREMRNGSWVMNDERDNHQGTKTQRHKVMGIGIRESGVGDWLLDRGYMGAKDEG